MTLLYRRLSTVALGAVAATTLAWAPQSASATTSNAVFSYTGAEQTYVVPAGTTSVYVTAIGAPGGNTPDSDLTGGKELGGVGSEVSAQLMVTPGETLYVEVGGPGADHPTLGEAAGGFNGGGSSPEGAGGGGGTDVRTCASATVGLTCTGGVATLSSRLLVAGGGGGAGGTGYDGTNNLEPGTGGNAELPGGNGASYTGSPFEAAGTGGQPGTLNGGGSGGPGSTAAAGSLDGAAGGNGDYGVGGAAPNGDTNPSNGGGGGGGYFGGGAGSGAESQNNRSHFGSGGGGGGGSSYAAGGSDNPASRAVNPEVIIGRVLPDAAVAAATAVTNTSAALHGTVNPNNYALSSCVFAYGTTSAVSTHVPCTPAAGTITGSTAVDVAASVTGLQPGTTYFVAVIADGEQGLGVSTQSSFTTTGHKIVKPTVTAVKASAKTAKSAKLSVTVNPGAGATSVVFQYGKTAKFGSHSKTLKVAAGTKSVKVALSLKGLKAHKKYHVRAVAANSAGVVVGKASTFTTKAKKHKKK